jgi:hypothetical protein
MKAPPRNRWPAAGQQIRIHRLDQTGGGLKRFVGILGQSLLTCGINDDRVSSIALAEVKEFQVLRPDGKPGTTWGAA